MRRSLSVDLQEVKKDVGREIVLQGGTACGFSRQLADAVVPSVCVMLDSWRAHKFRLDPVILRFCAIPLTCRRDQAGPERDAQAQR